MTDKKMYDEIKKLANSSGVRLQNTHGAPVMDTRPTLDMIISMSKVQVGDMIAKGKVINTINGGPMIDERRDQYIWRMHDMTSSMVVEEVELFGCDNVEDAIEDIVGRRREFGGQEPLPVPEFVIVGPQEFMVTLPDMFSSVERVFHFRFVRKEFGDKYYPTHSVPFGLFQYWSSGRYRSCEVKTKIVKQRSHSSVVP